MESLYKLRKMLELTKEERSAIESEDFESLESILLEKKRLMSDVSFSSQLDSGNEIRSIIEQIIGGGKENESLIHQKWLEDKNELARISDARRALSPHAPKRKQAARIVDRRC